jgi:signal transduction histidine kinase
VRGAGSAVFAAILLVVAGTLNIIYGIGALGDANVFVNDTRLIFSNLNTLGWVLIILGVIQLTAGFSLFGGGTYGRVIGIAAATLGAIDALMSVGGAYPFWSLGLFAICVIVIHGLVVLGEPERT